MKGRGNKVTAPTWPPSREAFREIDCLRFNLCADFFVSYYWFLVCYLILVDLNSPYQNTHNALRTSEYA
jgi:hypothetical protein